MKWKIILPVALIALVTAGGIAMSQATTPATPPGQVAPKTSTGSVLPVTTNPITNTSTTPGLTIVSAAAEDNVDPSSGAAITDRLQITLGNTTTSPLTNLKTYYVMKDITTGATEAYYLALDGLTLAPKAETTISFDTDTGPGHYPENTFSLYRSSTNQVDFTIQVSADGVQIVDGTATKGAGTGEQAD
ncbi:MAG: hypothetical protein LH475_03720 [Cryobacterium sp.]|uniref:hypothetical protein n=1 Tax=unclassified Cryobacterium TaxID=2649013 RepID=UPI0018CB4E83|nr:MULTISPECIES: hypothetical protein [unclassified Cryobacterium]MCY7403729.1 hypothetical protein [Cryobacterium sp.]MEC5155577.1 hypothetical protein [Cryobacterium sp. CAN_C3]